MAITTLPNTKGLNVTRYLAVYDRFDEIRESWNSPEVQQLVKDINKRAAFQKFIFPRFFLGEDSKNIRAAFFWFSTVFLRAERENLKEIEQKGLLENLTDERIEAMQIENRKRTIYMLNQLLIRYNESGYKNVNLKEITTLYDRIQAAEEAAKRTELARRKESRESFATYFNLLTQYGKLDEAEIDNLIQILKDARTTRQIQTSNS